MNRHLDGCSRRRANSSARAAIPSVACLAVAGIIVDGLQPGTAETLSILGTGAVTGLGIARGTWSIMSRSFRRRLEALREKVHRYWRAHQATPEDRSLAMGTRRTRGERSASAQRAAAPDGRLRRPQVSEKLAVFSTGPEIQSHPWNFVTEVIGTFVLVLVAPVTRAVC